MMRMEERAWERCWREEETDQRDGRMQVYQAVRLALYAASSSQVYVRSVVDYVRRRGEKSPARMDKITRTSRRHPSRANRAGPVAVFFVSAFDTAP